MIRATNLVKTYYTGQIETRVLHGLSLHVPPGQFMAIVGPSGSGKSTLLYQLSLLDHPTEGEVEIDSHQTSNLTSTERTNFRLTYLGYVFQDYALLPELTATENVMLPSLMQQKKPKEARQLAEKTLEMVGLGGKFGNLPSQLSGGQQQRVSIARAIAHKPRILFADEPTANLDTTTSREILNVFLELHRQGQTIIMVTHEMEFAKMAERIVELKDGTIVGDTSATTTRKR